MPKFSRDVTADWGKMTAGSDIGPNSALPSNRRSVTAKKNSR
jgi:hypothetical protein